VEHVMLKRASSVTNQQQLVMDGGALAGLLEWHLFKDSSYQVGCTLADSYQTSKTLGEGICSSTWCNQTSAMWRAFPKVKHVLLCSAFFLFPASSCSCTG
jgi:hypothetical protein